MYVVDESIRESSELGLWEASLYKEDWIMIVEGLHATI